MISVIYWFKEELYFCPPAQRESSTRILLDKAILLICRKRKIQQMALDIRWAVMPEGLESYVYSIYFLCQWSRSSSHALNKCNVSCRVELDANFFFNLLTENPQRQKQFSASFKIRVSARSIIYSKSISKKKLGDEIFSFSNQIRIHSCEECYFGGVNLLFKARYALCSVLNYLQWVMLSKRCGRLAMQEKCWGPIDAYGPTHIYHKLV